MRKQEKSLEPLIHSCMRDSCVVKSCHKEGGEGAHSQSLHLERTHSPQHLHKNSSFPSLLLYAMQDEGERTMSVVMPTQRDRSSHFPKGKRKKCLCFLAENVPSQTCQGPKAGAGCPNRITFSKCRLLFSMAAATHHSTLETPASVTFC